MAPGTQWVLPRCSMTASPAPVPPPGTQMLLSDRPAGPRVWREREGRRVPPGARPGEGRERVSGPVGSHLRCPSLCVCPPTSPSRVPGTRGPRRTHEHPSPAGPRTRHSSPTAARPRPAHQPPGSLAAGPQHAHCGHLTPETPAAPRWGAWPLPGHLLGSGKRTSP